MYTDTLTENNISHPPPSIWSASQRGCQRSVCPPLRPPLAFSTAPCLRRTASHGRRAPRPRRKRPGRADQSGQSASHLIDAVIQPAYTVRLVRGACAHHA